MNIDWGVDSITPANDTALSKSGTRTFYNYVLEGTGYRPSPKPHMTEIVRPPSLLGRYISGKAALTRKEVDGFKESAPAVTRTLRKRKEEFDIWHTAECVGEIGAATAPVALGVALAAARKNYATGRGLLCHFGDDDGQRTALFLTCIGEGS
jgi:hypothetical protein